MLYSFDLTVGFISLRWTRVSYDIEWYQPVLVRASAC